MVEVNTSPIIGLRRNEREGCWEVTVDLGIYGRLFAHKSEAEEYKQMLERVLEYSGGSLRAKITSEMKRLEGKRG